MNKISFIVLFAAFFILIQCEPPVIEEENTSLIGYWRSESIFADGFEIVKGPVNKFYQYDDKDKTISFAGNIVNFSSFSDASGFITVRITDSGAWGYALNEYSVVRWKNLNGNICMESTPYKAGNPSTIDSKEGAEAEFTIEKNYYAYFGEYKKR